MSSFFVGWAHDDAGAQAVHDRSRCPAACLAAAAGSQEYLGEFSDADQALAVARLRYGAIAACSLAAGAWPWPAPVRPLGRSPIPLRP